MPLRPVCFALVALVSAPALAADLPTAPSAAPALPALAADPAALSANWAGLYIGSGVSVVAGKGVKGGVGGEAFAGYDRHFDDHLVLGLRVSTGYAPLLVSPGLFNAVAYGATEAKLGYEFGRLTPYVVAGVGLARPTRVGGGLASAADIANGVFAGPGPVQAVGMAGAGFEYAVTNRVKVGLEARVYNSAGALGW